jgi:hypothetical protein
VHEAKWVSRLIGTLSALQRPWEQLPISAKACSSRRWSCKMKVLLARRSSFLGTQPVLSREARIELANSAAL